MARSPSEIPSDVVCQIFSVFARTLSVKRPALFPWFLGHICSTWRSIFLSMNTVFWHKISINDLTKKQERAIDIIRFFLERDPAAPFSFYVAWDELESDHHICKVMEMLADQSMRWKTATIHIPLQQMLPLIRIKNRIPLLQELHITAMSQHQDEYIDYEELYDIFRNAPSLDTVEVDYLHKWEFDLSNLKAIDINGLGNAAPFFAALPQMTKLERLRFGGMYDRIPSHAMPSSTIVLPNLTKLTCGKPDWLQFLKAPSLEGLFIECNNSAHSESVVLESFLSGSLNISSLGISRAPASTVIKIVRNAPKITYLQLSNIRPISDALKQLAIPINPIHEALAPRTDDLGLLYDLVSERGIELDLTH